MHFQSVLYSRFPLKGLRKDQLNMLSMEHDHVNALIFKCTH